MLLMLPLSEETLIFLLLYPAEALSALKDANLIDDDKCRDADFMESCQCYSTPSSTI